MARAANNGHRTAAVLASVVLVCALVGAARGDAARAQEREPESFAVREIWFSAAGPGRFLNAEMRAPESRPLRQALEGGLEIEFSLQVVVNRRRWWWLDQHVADINWRAALSYDSILRRYRLAAADGFRREYRTLRDALDRMGVLRGWPISPELAPILEDPNAYVLARLEVDVARLPQPVKILLLTDDAWDFDSGWTRLPMVFSPDSHGAPPSAPTHSAAE